MTGQVYIYDGSDPENVYLINSVYGGLWHFDVALQNNRLHIASEWYGILTIDISDIFNVIDLGKTLTGGWNTGSAVHGNLLAVANEGFGFKVFDISSPYNPQPYYFKEDSGFCHSVEFSSDGNYIYGFFKSWDQFRVYDVNTLEKVGWIESPDVGIRRTWVWDDKAVAITETLFGNIKNLFVLNVADPVSPSVETSRSGTFNDVLVDDNGKLFLTTNDSLLVYDLADNYNFLTGIKTGFLQNFKAMAKYKDTLFVYQTNNGLVRYLYDGYSTLTEDVVVSLPYGSPKFMSADTFGLYLVYQKEGLFALDKNDLVQKGYYEHGLEFVVDFLWGPQDIFCKNGFIYLVEYFGQTSVLTNNDNYAGVENPGIIEMDQALELFPNPARDVLNIEFSVSYKKPGYLEIYNVKGELVMKAIIINTEIRKQLNISGFSPGIYHLIYTNSNIISHKKFIKI